MYNLRCMFKALKAKSMKMIFIYFGVLFVLFILSFSVELFNKDSQRYFSKIQNNYIYGTEEICIEDCEKFYQSIETKNKTLQANHLEILSSGFYYETSFNLNKEKGAFSAIIGSDEHLLDVIYPFEFKWIFKKELMNDAVYIPYDLYKDLNFPTSITLSKEGMNFEKEYQINGVFKSDKIVKTIFYGSFEISNSFPIIVNEPNILNVFPLDQVEECNYIIKLENEIKKEDIYLIDNLYSSATYHLKQENSNLNMIQGAYDVLMHLVIIIFIFSMALMTLLFSSFYKSLIQYLNINSIFYLSIKERYLYSFLPCILLFTVPLVGVIFLGLIFDLILYFNFGYFINLFQISVVSVYLFMILVAIVAGFINIKRKN